MTDATRTTVFLVAMILLASRPSEAQGFRPEEVIAVAGKLKVDRFEIVNPKVQHHGDVAVLTYNLVNFVKAADGSESPGTRWNSTSVFRRIDGRWRTIHSHWSFTKPELKPVTP
jgi:ketosteroid isomerase-like protein